MAGHESHYEISDQGNVRSLTRPRTQRGGGITQGEMLNPWLTPQGRRMVSLEGGQKRLVSNLMLETYVSERPPGMQACHGPKGDSDDSLENLYWGTASRNNGEDKVRDGTSNRGTRSGHTRLSWFDVEQIRTRAGGGETQRSIGLTYGITQSAVSRIVTTDTWR